MNDENEILNWNEIYQSLVSKAWADPKFRKALQEDPKKMLAQEMNLDELPNDMQVECCEDTADTMHLVLPAHVEVAEDGSLSGEALDNISGGNALYVTHQWQEGGKWLYAKERTTEITSTPIKKGMSSGTKLKIGAAIGIGILLAAGIAGIVHEATKD